MQIYRRNILPQSSGFKFLRSGMALVTSYKEGGHRTEGEGVENGTQPEIMGRNRQRWKMKK
jgi:hypothetical protein